MTVSKPKMVCKTPSYLSKYIAGGIRTKTTKIAFHYTGAHDVTGINTINNWFNSINRGEQGNRYASSHFVMDLDGTIYEYVPMRRIAWTTNAANYYSIGIECATTGSDDHYTDKEYVSMVKLGAYLAQYYGLDPREDFIRHYDVTGKICPRYFVNNKSKWNQFKLDCYNYLHGKLKEENIRNCTNGEGNSIVGEVKQTPVENKIAEYKAISNVDIRKGSGDKYEKVGTLEKNKTCTIIEVKNKYGKIKSGQWIKLDKTVEEVAHYYKVDTDDLNVRKGSGVSYDKVGSVSKGDLLRIIEVKDGWGKIKSGQWVKLSYCKKM